MYQNDVNARLLETNGKFSSLKNTKHIKAKFFIKEKVDSKEVKIVDCSIEVR